MPGKRIRLTAELFDQPALRGWQRMSDRAGGRDALATTLGWMMQTAIDGGMTDPFWRDVVEQAVAAKEAKRTNPARDEPG